MPKLFGSQGYSGGKNWLDFSSIFFKICRFFAFAVSFHSTRSDARVRFDSGAIFLNQSQFFTTHSNQWNCFILYKSYFLYWCVENVQFWINSIGHLGWLSCISNFPSFQKMGTHWNFESIFPKIVHQKGLSDAIKENLNFPNCCRILHIYWHAVALNLHVTVKMSNETQFSIMEFIYSPLEAMWLVQWNLDLQ